MFFRYSMTRSRSALFISRAGLPTRSSAASKSSLMPVSRALYTAL